MQQPQSDNAIGVSKYVNDKSRVRRQRSPDSRSRSRSREREREGERHRDGEKDSRTNGGRFQQQKELSSREDRELFVGNILHPDATSKELKDWLNSSMQQRGFAKAHVETVMECRMSSKYAFIEFYNKADCTSCLQLNGVTFMGMIHLSIFKLPFLIRFCYIIYRAPIKDCSTCRFQRPPRRRSHFF